MKFSLLFAVSLTVTPMVLVHAAPLETCEQQSQCLFFQARNLPGTLCSINTADCPVEVCMRFDMNATGCVKGAGGTVSHSCDNANRDRCVRTQPWNALSTKGLSVDLDANGSCQPSTASDSKCETITDEQLMCQIGKPGTVLYWTVEVIGGGRECDANLTCIDSISSMPRLRFLATCR